MKTRARPGVPMVATALVAMCGCGAAVDSLPTAPPGPATATLHRIAGRVVNYQTGAPIAGVDGTAIGFSTVPFQTDADGRFTIEAADGSLTYTLRAPGFLERGSTLLISGPRADVRLDMIEDAEPFSLGFYRQFVRNSLERPGGSYSWTHAWPVDPSFYLRTVMTDGGETVPAGVIDGVRRVLLASVPELSGGRRRVADIMVGADAFVPRTGWVEVSFARQLEGGYAGVATLGYATGGDRYIKMRYDPTVDARVPPPPGCESRTVLVAEHEIVHTMGYFHTDDTPADFQTSTDGCTGTGRSAKARHHATVMYNRPARNTDPDVDPVGYLTPAALPQSTPIARCFRP